MSIKITTLPTIPKCNKTALIDGARFYHGNVYFSRKRFYEKSMEKMNGKLTAGPRAIQTVTVALKYDNIVGMTIADDKNIRNFDFVINNQQRCEHNEEVQKHNRTATIVW